MRFDHSINCITYQLTRCLAVKQVKKDFPVYNLLNWSTRGCRVLCVLLCNEQKCKSSKFRPGKNASLRHGNEH